jgi:FMN-dependent NADH-azoreductase
MLTILHLDSSFHHQDSVTRVLSKNIVGRLKTTHPDAEVIYRDLAKTPLPHVTPADLADPTFVDEFLRADVIVIGAPMYNLNIPSSLKAWLDRVVIAGKTFRYDSKGVEGLAGGRRIFIASSRGNTYAPPSPRAAVDFQETYLRSMFGFLGVKDITVVRAEGTGISELRQRAIDNALAEIRVLM